MLMRSPSSFHIKDYIAGGAAFPEGNAESAVFLHVWLIGGIGFALGWNLGRWCGMDAANTNQALGDNLHEFAAWEYIEGTRRVGYRESTTASNSGASTEAIAFCVLSMR